MELFGDTVAVLNSVVLNSYYQEKIWLREHITMPYKDIILLLPGVSM